MRLLLTLAVIAATGAHAQESDWYTGVHHDLFIEDEPANGLEWQLEEASAHWGAADEGIGYLPADLWISPAMRERLEAE